MNKKMKYTAPEITSEKINIGVFGSYGGCKVYSGDFDYNFIRKTWRKGRHSGHKGYW